MLDFILFCFLGVLTVAIAVLGGQVSSGSRKHRITFYVMGGISVVLILLTGYRTYLAQTEAKESGNRLNKTISSLSDTSKAIANMSKEALRVGTLNTELQERLLKQTDVISSKADKAVSFTSGGDSFPIVAPNIVEQNGKQVIGFYLNKQGEYPLYRLTVLVYKPYRNKEGNQTHGAGASFKLDEYNTQTSYPIYFHPLSQEAVVYFSVSMSARNGIWEEVIETRKVGSKTLFRWVVFGSNESRITPNKLLIDLADSDFPASVRHNPIYPLNIRALPFDPNISLGGK